MHFKFGFILDPLETLQETMDTSLLMISEANKRGHHVAFCTLDELTLLGNTAQGNWSTIHYIAKQTDLQNCAGEKFSAPLSEFDVIVMRKDPPFDKTYLAATYLLDHSGTTVINSPQGLREANEKLFILQWPNLCPTTFVSKDPEEILNFIREENGNWVIKPLDLYGGQKVFCVSNRTQHLMSFTNIVTANGTEYAVVQKFIESVYSGDKRVFLVDGKPIGQMNRIPPAGEFRANIHLGATPQRCELNERDIEIIETISPKLCSLGLTMVSIDIIGDYLTEINVTSPSGIPEINKVTSYYHEKILVDSLEKAAMEA